MNMSRFRCWHFSHLDLTPLSFPRHIAQLVCSAYAEVLQLASARMAARGRATSLYQHWPLTTQASLLYSQVRHGSTRRTAPHLDPTRIQSATLLQVLLPPFYTRVAKLPLFLTSQNAFAKAGQSLFGCSHDVFAITVAACFLCFAFQRVKQHLSYSPTLFFQGHEAICDVVRAFIAPFISTYAVPPQVPTLPLHD